MRRLMSDEPSSTTARRARLSLALLLAINLFNYIDRQVLAAVEPELRKQFFPGAKEEDALSRTGLLATAFLVTYMLTAPVFGWLADRTSRWMIVALSVIVWSLASGAWYRVSKDMGKEVTRWPLRAMMR